ncbi:MAG: alpha/beta hydrolase [Clostridia bacterium]|nr:alpha/beta hydrolase [Clostridia bacterium]
MTIFLILFGILDLVIVGLIFLLCTISLRQKPNNLIDRNLEPGSQLEHLRQSIVDGMSFFREHPGEPLLLKANDVDLYGKRFAHKEPKGRLILMHGYRSIAENDFAPVMGFYYSLGYELILVDQRAHGKSSGLWIGFGALERYDCKAWVEHLNRQYGAIPTFLSGISMGCTTVLMATSLGLPKNVRGILADCGFTSPKEIIAHVMKRRIKLPLTFLLPALSFFSKIFAGYSFGECSAENAMKTNQIPVLFIHGKSDNFVPYEMSVRNYSACAAEKTLLLIDGAGHGTSYLQEKETVERAVQDFLTRHNPIK